MATIYNLSLLPEIKQMKRVFIFLSINIGHRWQFSSTCRILSLMTSQVIATFVYVTHSQSVNTLKHYSYEQNYDFLRIYLVRKYFQV